MHSVPLLVFYVPISLWFNLSYYLDLPLSHRDVTIQVQINRKWEYRGTTDDSPMLHLDMVLADAQVLLTLLTLLSLLLKFPLFLLHAAQCCSIHTISYPLIDKGSYIDFDVPCIDFLFFRFNNLHIYSTFF
jgi:hypothetical protein